MSVPDPGGPIVRRLRGILQPARRRTVAAQLVAVLSVLAGLSALAVMVLVTLVRWLGPWWQQSR